MREEPRAAQEAPGPRAGPRTTIKRAVGLQLAYPAEQPAGSPLAVW